MKRRVQILQKPNGDFTIIAPELNSYEMAVVELDDDGNMIGYIRPMTKAERERAKKPIVRA
jgi:hypothetical protein